MTTENMAFLHYKSTWISILLLTCRLMVGRCPDIGERSEAYEGMHQHFGSTHENFRLRVSSMLFRHCRLRFYKF